MSECAARPCRLLADLLEHGHIRHGGQEREADSAGSVTQIL